MQKIIFILIAMIVHYIATGNAYYPSALDRSQSCWQDNTRAATIDTVQAASRFFQNGTGSPVCLSRSDLRELPQ